MLAFSRTLQVKDFEMDLSAEDFAEKVATDLSDDFKNFEIRIYKAPTLVFRTTFITFDKIKDVSKVMETERKFLKPPFLIEMDVTNQKNNYDKHDWLILKRIGGGKLELREPKKVRVKPSVSSELIIHPPSQVLYVGHLPQKIKRNELIKHFDNYGIIENVTILTSPSKMVYAFVKFFNLYMAKNALMESKGTLIQDTSVVYGFGLSNPSKVLWIGGLGPWLDIRRLKRILKEFGEVVNLEWPTNKNFAYVEYAILVEATLAWSSLGGMLLGCKKLSVDYSDHTQMASKLNYSHIYLGEDTDDDLLFEDGRAKKPRIEDRLGPKVRDEEERRFLGHIPPIMWHHSERQAGLDRRLEGHMKNETLLFHADVHEGRHKKREHEYEGGSDKARERFHGASAHAYEEDMVGKRWPPLLEKWKEDYDQEERPMREWRSRSGEHRWVEEEDQHHQKRVSRDHDWNGNKARHGDEDRSGEKLDFKDLSREEIERKMRGILREEMAYIEGGRSRGDLDSRDELSSKGQHRNASNHKTRYNEYADRDSRKRTSDGVAKYMNDTRLIEGDREDDRKNREGEKKYREDGDRKYRGDNRKPRGDDRKYGGDDDRKYRGDNRKPRDDDRKYGGDDRKYGDDDRKYGGDDRKYGDDDRKYREGDRRYQVDDRKYNQDDRKSRNYDRKYSDDKRLVDEKRIRDGKRYENNDRKNDGLIRDNVPRFGGRPRNGYGSSVTTEHKSRDGKRVTMKDMHGISEYNLKDGETMKGGLMDGYGVRDGVANIGDLRDELILKRGLSGGYGMRGGDGRMGGELRDMERHDEYEGFGDSDYINNMDPNNTINERNKRGKSDYKNEDYKRNEDIHKVNKRNGANNSDRMENVFQNTGSINGYNRNSMEYSRSPPHNNVIKHQLSSYAPHEPILFTDQLSLSNLNMVVPGNQVLRQQGMGSNLESGQMDETEFHDFSNAIVQNPVVSFPVEMFHAGSSAFIQPPLKTPLLPAPPKQQHSPTLHQQILNHQLMASQLQQQLSNQQQALIQQQQQTLLQNTQNNTTPIDYPLIWSGGLDFKGEIYSTDLHLINGSMPLVNSLLSGDSCLQISQKLRLDCQKKVDELVRRVEMAGRIGSCVLLASSSDTHLTPTQPISKLCSFLEQTQAAAVIFLSSSPSSTLAPVNKGILHFIPPSVFAEEFLAKEAPQLITSFRKGGQLLVILMKG